MKDRLFHPQNIIGNGLVARSIAQYSWPSIYVFFASGISNSKNFTSSDKKREYNLLLNTIHNNPNSKVIYFSTCSTYDPVLINSGYVQHKQSMEQLVRNEAPEFQIVRVSNLVGSLANKSTILSFLVNSIRNKQHFELWHGAKRNLIDSHDFVQILRQQLPLFDKDRILHVYNKYDIEVETIIKRVEQFVEAEANYSVIRGFNSQATIPRESYIDEYSGFKSPIEYLDNLLAKYYAD